jgi:hypothetical protein
MLLVTFLNSAGPNVGWVALQAYTRDPRLHFYVFNNPEITVIGTHAFIFKGMSAEAVVTKDAGREIPISSYLLRIEV